MKPSKDISGLIAIMKALRTPETGCPWDLEQTFKTITQYTIEETYEVVDAIERQDMPDLKEELGDLLLQVVFYTQMASEENQFDFGDVVEAITRKLIRRHPHVFGNARDLTPAQVKELWDEIKAEEKREKAIERQKFGLENSSSRKYYLDDIPQPFPALIRADKLTSKAAKVGFDWPTTAEVVAKIKEELAEVEEALETTNHDHVEAEIGDLLFSVANLARHLKIDPESALRRTNKKFESRFKWIEQQLAEKGLSLSDSNLQEMDMLWNEAKRIENE
ncbi:nucleoside triphosphate pyrophosphohydrolase [Microvirga sp. W0021]|uniref:Nucleoside triphosphate pyrophosphohydrolase n=1 Tax=Hohaiivirga grylli TaxID=3133970 RepID=A0ABV0BJG3_9HYPH